jgi:quercetin dioxygenase-like cupin family protein
MRKEVAIAGQAISLAGHIDYAPDAVVSKTLIDKPAGTLTLFAFAAGQGLSEHTSPYDAAVAIVEGEGLLTIGGRAVKARAGELVVMPAGLPHDVRAPAPFKMLLIMIRG